MSTTLLSPVVDYLTSVGGRDILRFPTSAEASEAAHALREQYENLPISVNASYNRVTIILGDFE